ncbi:MAG: peptide ABC transporter substrate-binding protein [Proteobacteria bacterium]|nr:MAG: peptide ABC transporter substrate-binding protein [Pseudomonadota bacterium]
MKRIAAALALAFAAACGNDPYPASDAASRVLYVPYAEAPKTLDPQVAYSVYDHEVIANLYETALEYHYLKRPFELIPALVEAVPEPQPRADGRIAYRFALRRGVRFAADPCFGLGTPGATQREVVAADWAFALQRIADPKVGSPVGATFAKIVGFSAFAERLAQLREREPGFAALRIDAQYARAGPVEGIATPDPWTLEIVLGEPYPQILYWFAMPFTSPVAWEAVAAYDGEAGRPRFAERAVGTGPYRIAEYAKRRRIALERNPTWWGVEHAGAGAPAAVYPIEGEPGDAEAGLLPDGVAGGPLPFLDRIEMRYEKELIPSFTKFAQGWYDRSKIPKESFDQAARGGTLSPEMQARGMRLDRTVMPGVYYVGFNMGDPVVGHAAGERGRKLRQAMSLAIDAPEFLRVFLNGRGIPAQSPVPPGLFGYDEHYRNPYRQVDLARARRLLAEAGYADGVDPATGRALRLTFDTGDPSVQARLRYEFLVAAWRRLGIDVEVAATSYNQFQEKVRRGAYQVFFWGWIADYPDPENFHFLLWSEMSQTRSGGPNSANFSDPRFDALFLDTRARANDAARLAGIRRMRALLEEERPWIEMFHPEDYSLSHAWLRLAKPSGMTMPVHKYWTVDPAARAAARAAWNQPVRWPAYALGALVVALLVPGVVTYLRERQ